ncbi:craniofacial development protein 2 [Elysia marginata]|uniref:Craniofacial development protein 2 n=1 Tax=Elysia marginata TaxID=1093978 RepID=A0AAV4EX18_9GAST|nr:craniofacial development protein 2 [Elysia marginata]
MNIVQVHAPTNEATDEEKDLFYDRLQGAVEQLPKNDVNIVIGDLNAKVGVDNRSNEEVMGMHGLGEVKQSIKRDKNRFLEEQTERAEQAGGNIRLVHQVIKTLSGKQSKPAIPVKDQQGNSIFTHEGQLARRSEHFEQFLNRPPPENPPDILPARNDLPINLEPPSKEEIAKAIKALKSNKVAGPYLIPPEALKAEILNTVDILYGDSSRFISCFRISA